MKLKNGTEISGIVAGEIMSVTSMFNPSYSAVMLFAAMALVLAVRPRGLLGSAELMLAAPSADAAPLVASHRFVQTMLALLAALTLLPLAAGDYALGVASEILILGLFSGSLLLVTGLVWKLLAVVPNELLATAPAT